MTGVTIEVTEQLEFASDSDAVLFGSGIYTKEISQDLSILNRIKLDPDRQLIGAQCSGTSSTHCLEGFVSFTFWLTEQ